MKCDPDNIEPAVICVGDHWTAGERLVDLIVRIGEMISYQANNSNRPTSATADNMIARTRVSAVIQKFSQLRRLLNLPISKAMVVYDFERYLIGPLTTLVLQ